MKQNKYKKGFTLVEIMIVVVIIGLLTTMAIPALNKIREQSREKVIQSNLRQLANVAQEYILNEGVAEVSYETLVNEEYLNSFTPVAGEDYSKVTITESTPSISVETTGGQVVVYSYAKASESE